MDATQGGIVRILCPEICLGYRGGVYESFAVKVIYGILLISTIWTASTLHADLVSDLTMKANAGDVVAQTELGDVFAKGQGAPRNEKEAVKWYVKAAEQGGLTAQVSLAGIYIRGSAVLKNSREAAKWYLMAAEQGDVTAQCQAGRLYMMGAGVPKDDVQAYKWCNLAAAKGNISAKTVIRVLEKRMVQSEIIEAQELCRTFLEMKKLDEPNGEAPPIAPIPPEVLEPDGN